MPTPWGPPSLSVYRRPDTYYLVRLAKTASDAFDGPPAVQPPLNATVEVLGDAVWKLAKLEGTPVPRPPEQE